jgi:hypothetical protein
MLSETRSTGHPGAFRQRKQDARTVRDDDLCLAQHRIDALALGDVALHGDVVATRPVAVAPGRDGHLLVVERAVLAPVDELSLADLPGGDRAPQLGVERWILLIRLEQSRVAADHLVGGVAGQR